MVDISSYCASEAREEEYEPLQDSRFANCKDSIATAAGNVKIEVLENPKCDNEGKLTQGKISAYVENSNSYKAYCVVDIRPFTCYIK